MTGIFRTCGRHGTAYLSLCPHCLVSAVAALARKLRPRSKDPKDTKPDLSFDPLAVDECQCFRLRRPAGPENKETT